MEVKEIPTSKIIVSELNVRKNLEAGNEDSTLDDLADSIRENGLLNPITVVKKGDRYELIVGQRRFLACQKIGLENISAIIRDDLSDIDGVTLSLIENVHRADMHPIDKARAYQNLYDIYGTFQKVSKESGVSTSTVKKYLTLLKLAPEIQNKLTTSDGIAGIGTLSVLAQIFPDHDDQLKVLNKIRGFNQRTQLELLKRSEGKLSNLFLDIDLALEGAFEIHKCTGLFDCEIIPDELKAEIQEKINKIDRKKDKEVNFDQWRWVDIRWAGDEGFIRFEREDIEELWGEDVFQAIENLRVIVDRKLKENGLSSLSKDIPEHQHCIKCNLKARSIDDKKGQKWVINLIGISLDNFVEKYPSINKLCEDPSSYAIDLCESCVKRYKLGELEVTLDEIIQYAYRFV